MRVIHLREESTTMRASIDATSRALAEACAEIRKLQVEVERPRWENYQLQSALNFERRSHEPEPYVLLSMQLILILLVNY